MNIGKDIMGTMSNTLILAFAGSSLNMILFIIAYGMPYRQIVNLDFLVAEVIQGISGSIGIVLTVPITALLHLEWLKVITVVIVSFKHSEESLNSRKLETLTTSAYSTSIQDLRSER